MAIFSEPFLVNGAFKATWFGTVVRLVLDPIVGLICSRKYLASTKCRIDRRKWRVRELLQSYFFPSSSPTSTRWLPMHRARSLQGPSTTLLVVILGTKVARVQVHIHLIARCKANPPRSHYPAFFFGLPPSPPSCNASDLSGPLGGLPQKWRFCCSVESLCLCLSSKLSYLRILPSSPICLLYLSPLQPSLSFSISAES